jgi:hypothetical protein
MQSTAAELLDQMIPYHEEIHHQCISVSAQILAFEMRCLDPEMLELGLEVFHQCILLLLKKHHLMHHFVSHMAQKICFLEHIMNDGVTYINKWIVAGKY